MDRRQYLGVLGSIASGLYMEVVSAETRTAESQTSEFVQRQRIVPDDGEAGDEFGERVALGADGTTLLTTTQSDADPNGNLAGSAYLFERMDGEFIQQTKIVPDDGDSQDFFGFGGIGMSADGTTMFVSAINDEDPNGQLAGSGYVFDRTADGVVQRAKIAAPDGEERDRFGNDGAVSPDGTTVVVGAPGREGPDGARLGGVAFVFERTENGFTYDSTLSAPDVDGDDKYGVAVAVSSEHIFVGASGNEDTGDDTTGSVYIYDRGGDSSTPQQELTASAAGTDGFGSVLAVQGDTVAVGIGGARDSEGEAVGGIALYQRTDGTFDRVDDWARPDGQASDPFPQTVSLGESTVAVGGANAAYTVARDSDGLGETTELVRNKDDDGDDFGNSVTVDTGIVVAGAPDDEDPNGKEAGAVYVFDRGRLAVKFDDGDGEIDRSELFDAIDAFQNDNLDRSALFDIIDEFQSDNPRWSNV